MTKTPTAYVHTKSLTAHALKGLTNSNTRGEKKRLRGCAATDEKVLVPAYVVVQRSSRFKKSQSVHDAHFSYR
jgi:hypothetical protein